VTVEKEEYKEKLEYRDYRVTLAQRVKLANLGRKESGAQLVHRENRA
jgi:hypothetical protein